MMSTKNSKKNKKQLKGTAALLYILKTKGDDTKTYKS